MPPVILCTRPLTRTVIPYPTCRVLDFLAPRTIQKSRIHSAPVIRSSAAQPATHDSISSHDTSTTFDDLPPPRKHNGSSTPPTPLSPAQLSFLDSALRVNQAGELAATLIYTSQTPPLVKSHPSLRPLMQHMYDQEVGHLSLFNNLLAKHRVRPTAMYPVWGLAARVLGWGTAVMGKEAAMACTEAVETEIGGHYNSQVTELLQWADRVRAERGGLGEELETLIQELRRIRDEELEHLDHAVAHDSKEARPYELLTNVIRSGCRTAIWISEKV